MNNIVHISLLAPFNEGWGYQENLLPKYQQALGNNVTLITTDMQSDTKSGLTHIGYCDKISVEGFRLIRLPDHKCKLLNKLNYYDIKHLLNELSPDIIMFHNLCSVIPIQAIKYKRSHKDCKIIADNHVDENNSKPPETIKSKLIHYFWILFNTLIQKHYSVVFGVTEGRITFANKYFKINNKKLDLLPAGVDDEYLKEVNRDNIRDRIREELGFIQNDFVIVTGGKIDKKKNIDKLICAVKEKNVKLIIFGSIDVETSVILEPLIDNVQIKYVGWLNSQQIIEYFYASDLACFPGLHSVLWEQACACGLPAIYNDITGLHHVDVGGNCLFVDGNNVFELEKAIQSIINNKEKFNSMKQIATINGIKNFSYYSLARKASLLKNNR